MNTLILINPKAFMVANAIYLEIAPTFIRPEMIIVTKNLLV